MHRKILRDPRFHRLALITTVAIAGLALILWKQGVDAKHIKLWWGELQAFLAVRPWWLFVALVFLPGFPMPASALMLLAGAVWHDHPVRACAICLAALLLNLCWTYGFAAKPARKLVESLLRKRQWQVPTISGGNQVKLILIMRVSGMPLFLQNYALGLLKVNFGLYLLISMALTGAFACGVVLTGAGLGNGRITNVMGGVGLLIVGVVVIQWLRSRMASGKRTKVVE